MHIEGQSNVIKGHVETASHVEGTNNTSNTQSGSSHVEGTYNTALSSASHASGYYNVSNAYAQTAIGLYGSRSTVTLSAAAASGATSLTVSAITHAIDSGTILTFSSISTTTTAAASVGDTSLTVSALSAALASGAVGDVVIDDVSLFASSNPKLFKVGNGTSTSARSDAFAVRYDGSLVVGSVSTGSGSAALGANCPATTLTAPSTWIKMETPSGTTVYVPAWA